MEIDRKEIGNYRKAHKAAENEIAALVDEKERITTRINALRKIMNALATLISQEDEKFLSDSNARVWHMLELTTTDDILNVVSLSSEPMTSSEVLAELKKLGCTAIQHSNPLATINAVLNRLVEQGKLDVTKKGERKAWTRKPVEWKPREKETEKKKGG